MWLSASTGVPPKRRGAQKLEQTPAVGDERHFQTDKESIQPDCCAKRARKCSGKTQIPWEKVFCET